MGRKKDGGARALTIHRTIVTPPEREKYFARSRARAEWFKRANCNFWVFEEVNLPGAFIEFTEGPSRAVLTAALAEAPEGGGDTGRVYQEVELG